MAGVGDYKPIKLLKYTTSVDANGDAGQTVQTYTFWAEVSDNGGGRSQSDGRTSLSSGKTFKIWFRVNEFLNADWKIKYFGQTYSVTNVQRIDEKRFNCLISANVQS
jgi:SPP1 family predicted phage head-tail adaptor